MLAELVRARDLVRRHPVTTISALLGHSSIAVTARYLAVINLTNH